LKNHWHPSSPQSEEKNITNAGEVAEKKEASCTVAGNKNECNHYGNQYEVSSKN
jgi:hypothetical protein